MKNLLRQKNLLNLKSKRLINYSSNLNYPFNSQIKTLDHILFYEELCSQSKDLVFEQIEKKKLDCEDFNFEEIEKEFFPFDKKVGNKYALSMARNKKKEFLVSKRKLKKIKNLNKKKNK